MKRPLVAGALAAFLLLLAACGDDPAPPTPTLNPLATQGRQVFQANCATCHAVVPDTIIVGPSLAGVASRAGSRVSDQDAETYLLTSVMRPDTYIVDGFENLMPSTLARTLSGEEVDAVIAYLLTLK